MSIEDKVKEIITSRYNSVRDFAISEDIPYTTIKSMLTRGFLNSSVGNVIHVCNALGISADRLADGEISFVNPKRVSIDRDIDVMDMYYNVRDVLLSGVNVTIAGDPIERSEIASIIDALEIGIQIAKRRHSYNKNHNKNHNKNAEITESLPTSADC